MSRLAIAQCNPRVGDLADNAATIRKMADRARSEGAVRTVFPTGALTGLPLGDLARDGDFIDKVHTITLQLLKEYGDTIVLDEPCLTNFTPPKMEGVLYESAAHRYYRGEPAERWRAAAANAKTSSAWIAQANLVGGQDDHIYAGGSFVADPAGSILTAKLFEEDLLIVDAGSPLPACQPPAITPATEMYGALVLAVRDYATKNRFAGIGVAISGGIDSAVAACLAVDAVGAEKVRFLTLPSAYSSSGTISDSHLLAKNLGVSMPEISIEGCRQAFAEALGPVLADGPDDPEKMVEQNLQARIRCLMIMALSNRYHLLILNTSNHTEAAVGYGTLYGDIAGGFAPLQNVWKTEVWDLAREINRAAGYERLPQSIIDRVPSAELRPDQEDRQSIPDYPVLDVIMRRYLDEGVSYSGLLEQGFEEKDIHRAIHLNYVNLFKAVQAPIGPCLTKPSEKGRTGWPISNAFRPWN